MGCGTDVTWRRQLQGFPSIRLFIHISQEYLCSVEMHRRAAVSDFLYQKISNNVTASRMFIYYCIAQWASVSSHFSLPAIVQLWFSWLDGIWNALLNFSMLLLSWRRFIDFAIFVVIEWDVLASRLISFWRASWYYFTISRHCVAQRLSEGRYFCNK